MRRRLQWNKRGAGMVARCACHFVERDRGVVLVQEENLSEDGLRREATGEGTSKRLDQCQTR